MIEQKDNDELTAAYLAGCHATRKAYEQRLAEAESRVCKWQEDSDTDNNLWNGECGAVWEFIADGPAENNCNFCPECGGKLVIAQCSQQGSSEKGVSDVLLLRM